MYNKLRRVVVTMSNLLTTIHVHQIFDIRRKGDEV